MAKISPLNETILTTQVLRHQLDQHNEQFVAVHNFVLFLNQTAEGLSPEVQHSPIIDAETKLLLEHFYPDAVKQANVDYSYDQDHVGTLCQILASLPIAKQTHEIAQNVDLPDFDQKIVKACKLPFTGQITDDIDLTNFKQQYRSHHQFSCDLSEDELKVLYMGPTAYAEERLDFALYEDSPIFDLEQGNLPLQEPFFYLEANNLAGQALLVLHQSGELALTPSKIAQIKQLAEQRHKVACAYCEYERYIIMQFIAETAKEVSGWMKYDLKPGDLSRSAKTQCYLMLQQYCANGRLHLEPSVLDALYQADFLCANPDTQTWLNLLQLWGVIHDYYDYLSSHCIEFKVWLSSIQFYMEQTSQTFKLRYGCSITAALDREFSGQYLSEDDNGLNHLATLKNPPQADLSSDPRLSQANHNMVTPYNRKRIDGAPSQHFLSVQIGSQGSTVALEQRHRQDNVVLNPNYKLDPEGKLWLKHSAARLAYYPQSIWYQPESKAAPDVIYLDFSELSVHDLPCALDCHIGKHVKTNQRYHLSWRWQRLDTGHIVALARYEPGFNFVLDSQLGSRTALIDYFEQYGQYMDLSSFKLYRVDDCEILVDYAALVLAQTPSKTPH